MAQALNMAESLAVTGLEDKTRKYGTLKIRAFINPDGSSENTWVWIGGPDGLDNGVFNWKQRYLELYTTRTDPKSFVWAVVNHRWKLDGRPLPRPSPWFSAGDTIHIVNEEKRQEFDAKRIS